MASLQPSERLAHKSAVAYNEIESGSRWQLKTLVDSNLPCTISHVDFPYQMHPRRHADPYVHETRDGVTQSVEPKQVGSLCRRSNVLSINVEGCRNTNYKTGKDLSLGL